MIYSDFVRPFLLVAVEKAKQLPALEPYACQFLSHEVRGPPPTPPPQYTHPPTHPPRKGPLLRCLRPVKTG